MKLLVLLVSLAVASQAFGAQSCVESPTGVWTCDQNIARDNNALPTPVANAVRLTGNSATISVMPTPAANACLFYDRDASATDECVLSSGTSLMHIPPRSSELPRILVTTKTTTPYTATATEDEVILCDATAQANVVNLPAAATAGSGRRFTIKKIDSSGNTCAALPAGKAVLGSTFDVKTGTWSFPTS